MPATIVTAVVLYAGTNIDDMIVLAVVSASSRATGRPRRWEIWAGQYTGIAVLVGGVAGREPGPGPYPQQLALAARPARYGHWIIPLVYILIALYIFQKEDALAHLG